MAIVRGALSTPIVAVGSGQVGSIIWGGTQPAAGSKVLLFVQFNAAVTTGNTTVVDNGTSQRSFALDRAVTTGKGCSLWRADNITRPASGNYTVTWTTTLSVGTIGAGGIAYAGVAAGGPTATNIGSGTGTAVSCGAVSPAGPGALYIGLFSDGSSVNPETITPTWASATQEFVQTNGSSLWPWACADLIGSGAQTPTWTLGDSIVWGGFSAVYDAAGAAPPARLLAGRTPLRPAMTASQPRAVYTT